MYRNWISGRWLNYHSRRGGHDRQRVYDDYWARPSQDLGQGWLRGPSGVLMIVAQLQDLEHFSEGEADAYGKPINWEEYAFDTMQQLDVLRSAVGSPCHLIRGNHGKGKESAVDCFFPFANYGLVVMELTRLSHMSWGVYSTRSVHLDTRLSDGKPRRWMAFKPQEKPLLVREGLNLLITAETDEWVYVRWSSPQGFDALRVLVERARRTARIQSKGVLT